jgi:hypothetical protein
MRESFQVPDERVSGLPEQRVPPELFSSSAVPHSGTDFSEEHTAFTLRAQQKFDHGCRLAEYGESELALLAFQAALHSVLCSKHPGDVALRRKAAQRLLCLMRGIQ